LAKNEIVTPYDDASFPVAAAFTTAIAAGASTTTLKPSPGRLCRVSVTTAGTSTDNITIYDNASAGSGEVLAVIPGGGTLGTIYVLDVPAVNGITAVNVASGPAVTIGWS
jgi:hypothetical protein